MTFSRTTRRFVTRAFGGLLLGLVLGALLPSCARAALVPCEYRPQARAAVNDLARRIGPDATVQFLLAHAPEPIVRQFIAEVYGPPCGSAPVTNAPSTGTWKDKLSRQALLFDGPAYFWRDLNDGQVRAWLEAVSAAGLDGVDIEMNGPFPVYEYIGQRVPNLDVAAEYEKSFARLPVWIAEARRLGLLLSIKVLNSNQSDANKMSDAWWKGIGQRVAALGADNLLVLHINETDPRTRASIGRAILDGLLAGGFPKPQLIAYGAKNGLGFSERHPQSGTDVQRGDRSLLQISDSGPAIQFLYGADWRNGGKPNPANIAAFTQRIRSAGTSGGIYSFRRSPDLEGLKAAAAAWRAGSAPASVNVQDDPLPAKVTWLHTDVSSWPVTSTLDVSFKGSSVTLAQTVNDEGDGNGEAGTTANPWVIAEITPGSGAWYAATWEWMRRDNDTKAVRAIAGDHIKAKPFPADWRPAQGQQIYLAVSGLVRGGTKNDRERTPFVRVVMP